MSEDVREVHCQTCGVLLQESPDQPAETRKPCPSCGSMARTIHISVGDVLSLTLKRKLRLKARRPGRKKPIAERVVGDDLYRKADKWMHLERIIDVEGDLYHERVTDPSTGQVVHDVKEPLSKHRGHGSAKKTPRK